MAKPESATRRFFKTFDSYGKWIGLTINNKDVHNTALGGVWTLLIFAICITYAWIVILNPLEARTSVRSVTSVTNSSTVSEGSIESTIDLGNGYEINGYYQTRVTTKSMKFYTIKAPLSKTYNWEKLTLLHFICSSI